MSWDSISNAPFLSFLSFWHKGADRESCQAFRDVVFRARGHNSQFKIDAGTVLLPGLPSLQARSQARSEARRTNQTQTVYQLCICRSPKHSSLSLHHLSLSLLTELAGCFSPPLTHSA